MSNGLVAINPPLVDSPDEVPDIGHMPLLTAACDGVDPEGIIAILIARRDRGPSSGKP